MELRNLQAIYTMTISLLMEWLGTVSLHLNSFSQNVFLGKQTGFCFKLLKKTGRGGGIAVPNHSIIHKLYRKICNYFKADIACKCLNSMTRNLTLLLIKKTGAGLSGVLCENKIRQNVCKRVQYSKYVLKNYLFDFESGYINRNKTWLSSFENTC